jgi:hypothetical protein
LKDGKLSEQEASRIQAAQNKISKDIAVEKHDAQTGNPNSASSMRSQAIVERNAKQEQRIANGVKEGSLTNKEVAHLEHGQARNDRKLAVAAADGHVGKQEVRHLEHKENRSSSKIAHEKHDAQERN